MSQASQPTKTAVESTETRVEDPGVPVWLILLLGLLVYLGLDYLDTHGGWFSPAVFAPYKTYEELATAQPHNPEGDYLALGKKTFEASCILCHQANGLGKEGQFPPLDGSDWLNAAGPNRIGRIVLNGLSGPVRVNSSVAGLVSLNATMNPLGGTYTDKELGAALTYVRQNWSNKSGKITPEQIAKIRAAIKDHPGPFAPSELEAIPVK